MVGRCAWRLAAAPSLYAIIADVMQEAFYAGVVFCWARPACEREKEFAHREEKLSASMACKYRARLCACRSPHCNAIICYDARARTAWDHGLGARARGRVDGRSARPPARRVWPPARRPRAVGRVGTRPTPAPRDPASPPARGLVSRQAHACKDRANSRGAVNAPVTKSVNER